MDKVKIIILAMVLSVVVGCASTYQAKVKFDTNSKIDTSEYKTFAWLKESKILAASDDVNPVMKVRLDNAVENAFIEKGYQLITSAENADFTISYTVGNREKIKIDHFPASYNTGFFWGRGYFGRPIFHSGVAFESKIRNYTEGKLAIDVFDVKSHQPAWHGWAVKRISSSEKNDPESTIKRLVTQVVANF